MYYPESATELTWEVLDAASRNDPWANTASGYSKCMLAGKSYFAPVLNPSDFAALRELTWPKSITDVIELFREVSVPDGALPALGELSSTEVQSLRKVVQGHYRGRRPKSLGFDSMAFGFADGFSANPAREYTDLQAFYRGKALFELEERLPIVCALLDANVRANVKLRDRIAGKWKDIHNEEDTWRAVRTYGIAQRLGFEQNLGLTPESMEHLVDRMLFHMDSDGDACLFVEGEHPVHGRTLGGMYRNLRVLKGGARAAVTFGAHASTTLTHAKFKRSFPGYGSQRTAYMSVIRGRRFMRREANILRAAAGMAQFLVCDVSLVASRTRKMVYLAAVVDETESRGQEPDYRNVAAGRKNRDEVTRREYINDGLMLGRSHPKYTEVRKYFSQLKDELDPVFSLERQDLDEISPPPPPAGEELVLAQP